MADNITSAATFTTANMKPAAGEQIDALWGDNLGDNTGYVYYRKEHYPPLSISYRITSAVLAEQYNYQATTRATTYFNHRTEFATLHGSYYIFGSSGADGVGLRLAATFFCDGTSIFGTECSAASAGEGSSTGSFVFVKSHLTHNTDYTISARMSVRVGTNVAAVLNVAHFGVT